MGVAARRRKPLEAVPGSPGTACVHPPPSGQRRPSVSSHPGGAPRPTWEDVRACRAAGGDVGFASWQAFYESDTQAVYAVVTLPAAFLGYLAPLLSRRAQPQGDLG